MEWFAQAPSNIALIKYMGKKESGVNIPVNPSLSYTLNNLISNVSLEAAPGTQDLWEPLPIPGGTSFNLSPKEQQRFLQHLAFIKSTVNYSGAFIVKSNNNFPISSGLASSASSFAALTKCAAQALSDLTGIPLPSIAEQAKLSRHGSGSSCRSFFSPWAYWDENEVKEIRLPYTDLIHQVIIVSHDEKSIPSSLAHERVRTSPQFAARPEKATEHLSKLVTALEKQDWRSAYQICWQEFHDMHALFTTSMPPFTFMTPESQTLLDAVETFWDQQGDGPIVTMDAGPNIHLLYRRDQQALADTFRNTYVVNNYDII